jgi:hypothetical protein
MTLNSPPSHRKNNSSQIYLIAFVCIFQRTRCHVAWTKAFFRSYSYFKLASSSPASPEATALSWFFGGDLMLVKVPLLDPRQGVLAHSTMPPSTVLTKPGCQSSSFLPPKEGGRLMNGKCCRLCSLPFRYPSSPKHCAK